MSAIVGIDEVGRGCWAGPLVAAAVILDHNFSIPKEAPWKLGDSKLLSKRQREVADKEIQKIALAIGLGWIDATVVDEVGLTVAVRMAMSQALTHITVGYDEIIIDGNFNFLTNNPKAKAIIKADMTIPEVSAASIVAKVARDRYMAEAGIKFPHYQFEKHVGYGTKLHSEMLKLHGVCELHRLSYKPVKALL